MRQRAGPSRADRKPNLESPILIAYNALSVPRNTSPPHSGPPAPPLSSRNGASVTLRTDQLTPINVASSRGAKTLRVPMHKQEQPQWCWAGAALMILHYYGRFDARQCGLADWAFGLNFCCVDPSSSACNRPLGDPHITRLFHSYSLTASYSRRPVPHHTLQFEIDANRPAQIGWTWNGGTGHVVVVVGWGVNKTGPFFLIYDPDGGSGGIYYDDLLDAGGYGVWDATWTGIGR